MGIKVTDFSEVANEGLETNLNKQENMARESVQQQEKQQENTR